MKKKIPILIVIIIILIIGISLVAMKKGRNNFIDENMIGENGEIKPDMQINRLSNGLSTVKYDNDYAFEKFLEQGGASSDSEVVQFLVNSIGKEMSNIEFNNDVFGCSTIAVKNNSGDNLFGRNFDWNHCQAMIVMSNSNNNYSSISTVNMDFISASGATKMAMNMSDEIKTIASLYAPLDGMNEKGLCVAVNMIQDSSTINQNTSKPDITTTTAVRLLLNKASNVDEAINLLQQYDMHASMNYMVHFAISDRSGKSVVIEYINNEMQVIDTPIVTNFYLAEGSKHGIGTSQSHTRFEMLTQRLEENKTMSMEDVRDALDSVSKKNFGEFESTEWSIVYNKNTGDVCYYHRENYDKEYRFKLDM